MSGGVKYKPSQILDGEIPLYDICEGGGPYLVYLVLTEIVLVPVPVAVSEFDEGLHDAGCGGGSHEAII